MTVYVLSPAGTLVPKSYRVPKTRSDLPSPRVSRLETFDSPVTGKSVSSWRQRDADMKAADAVDRRDIPAATFEKRKKIVERNKNAAPVSYLDAT